MPKTLRLLCLLLVLVLVAPAAQAQSAGDLIITELMPDPSDVGDSAGEYFEVYNDTDAALNLNGLTFTDAAANAFTVNDDVSVPANGFAVLCVNGDPAANGGVPCDYDYPNGFSLNQSNESVTITDASDTQLFTVSYDDGNPFGAGVALELADVSAGQDGATAEADYQAAESNIDGEGDDLGSPGAAGTTQGTGGGDPAPTVQFTAASATAGEGDGAATLTVSLSDPDGTEVSVDVAFDADASTAETADIGGYTTQTVTFPASAADGATRDVTVSITDDAEDEADETAAFVLANVQSGSGAASLGAPAQFDLTIEDNDEAPATTDLVINEFLADPNGAIDTDLNGDGTADTGDEFVEIVNTGDAAVDLSGYQLDDVADGGGSPYTFPDGTLLDAGAYAVVLGDANGQTFGAFTDSGLPSLNNGGDDIRLLDDEGTVLTAITYPGAQATEGVSQARNPDGAGDFAAQNTFGEMPNETAGQNNNTGTGNDDGGDPPTVQFTAASATAGEGDGAATLTVSIANPDGSEVSVDVVFDGGDSSADGDDLGGFASETVTFPASAEDGDTETVSVPLTDDDMVEGDETAAFDLANAMGAALGDPQSFTLTIEDNDAPPPADLAFNEILYDPALDDPDTDPVEGDANGDGTRDAGDDEFAEILNTGDTALDLEGYTLVDDGGTTYTFPAGAQVGAGEIAVVFGGGTPTGIPGAFVGTGLPSLANSGDALTLNDDNGTLVAQVAFGSSGTPSAADQSIARAPDGSGDFVPHTTIDRDGDDMADGDPFSPGEANVGAGSMEMDVEQDIAGPAGWRMLAPPVAGLTVADLAAKNLVQGIPGVYGGKYDAAAPNLYTSYDGPDDSVDDWVAASEPGEELESGRGFIWYFYDEALVPETVPVPFTLSATGTPPPGDVAVDVADTEQSFFLLGNPYAQAFDLTGLNLNANADGDDTDDFSSVVQIWDPATGTTTDEDGNTQPGSYQIVTRGSDTLVARWQGFFVERNDPEGATAQSLTFSAEGQSEEEATFYRVARSGASAEALFRHLPLRLVGRDAEGRAVTRDEALALHFHEQATDGWDAFDATKLTPLAAGYATLAFAGEKDGAPRLKAQESRAYAPGAALDVPLAFSAQGTEELAYTVAWPQEAWTNIPEDWTLTLTDHAAGVTVDLRTETAYTFAPAESAAPAVATSAAPGASARPNAASIVRPQAAPLLRTNAPGEEPRFTLTVEPGTLPVEMTRFEASADGDRAVLRWQTASETGSEAFEVQHRAPGAAAFAAIGRVEAAGDATEPTDYTHRTAPLALGKHTFRLRPIDRDGTATLSREVEVAIGLAEPYALRAPYPNPFASAATVAFAVREAEPVRIDVYNVLGQRVQTLFDGTPPAGKLHEVTLRGDGLPSGVYVVRLVDASYAATQRVVLVK